ncbi:hypothetical protein RSAG8_04044, partial [Rhizoctonia solani AG-8 WAC10335]
MSEKCLRIKVLGTGSMGLDKDWSCLIAGHKFRRLMLC